MMQRALPGTRFFQLSPCDAQRADNQRRNDYPASQSFDAPVECEFRGLLPLACLSMYSTASFTWYFSASSSALRCQRFFEPITNSPDRANPSQVVHEGRRGVTPPHPRELLDDNLLTRSSTLAFLFLRDLLSLDVPRLLMLLGSCVKTR